MALISPREARIRAGLPALQKEMPRRDVELYAGFETAKQAITAILRNIDVQKIKIVSANDLYKISVSLSALIKAQADFERWQAERFGFMDEAQSELLKIVKNELAHRPELREQLEDVIQEAQAARKAAA